MRPAVLPLAFAFHPASDGMCKAYLISRKKMLMMTRQKSRTKSPIHQLPPFSPTPATSEGERILLLPPAAPSMVRSWYKDGSTHT